MRLKLAAAFLAGALTFGALQTWAPKVVPALFESVSHLDDGRGLHCRWWQWGNQMFLYRSAEHVGWHACCEPDCADPEMHDCCMGDECAYSGIVS